MGIQIEFNPDLALRAYNTEGREADECLPQKLEKSHIYPFLKEGQRVYWFGGEILLVETTGNQQLSRPLAAIRIPEATHFTNHTEVYTKGKYVVTEVYDTTDPKIHFEGWTKR
ncbi:MAG TPA: hypothetical protein VJK51_05450 [Candidatus Nanoarchaeia archaeon]|nr:hypothetical protein [Candidatus Nanoarchaeia archaeon]